MTDVVLALLIAVPIIAAVVPLLSSVRSKQTGWPIAAVVCLIEVGLATVLVRGVYRDGRLVHEVGGYPAPYGIELVGDGLSAPIVVLVAVVSLGVLGFARRGGPRRNSFYSVYLLLVGGLMGTTVTGDMFNMFVFLEITGLSTYALVASDRSGRSAIAALKYLILGTTGASMFLVGVGYAFIATGTLNMVDLSAELAALYSDGGSSTVVLASFGFIVVGLGMKAAIFPLHTWQPDAYQYAPDTVSAFISALVSTVAAYAIGRVVLTVYTVSFFEAEPLARTGVLAVACVSVLAGSGLAVVQRDLKRMFAYSSVAQFGLIVAAFALATPDAVLGAVIHLVGHGLTKGGLFVAGGILATTHGARTVDSLARLGYRSPISAAGMAALGLVLVGVPPSIGFLGKWYIALGAIRASSWPVAVVVLLSTLLSLAYVARLLERLYFATPEDPSVSDDAHPTGTDSPASRTDGGTLDTGRESSRPDTQAPAEITGGMIALVVVVVAVVVGLGFATDAFQALVDPFVVEVLS